MNSIEKVKIEKFWGDKEVSLSFKPDVNFLIGVNGSGKTTIINLIAATLKADFSNISRIEFEKLTIHLKPRIEGNKKLTAYIEVKKFSQNITLLPSIKIFIKDYKSQSPIEFELNELTEEYMMRDVKFFFSTGIQKKYGKNRISDVQTLLRELVSVSWLSIHRTTSQKFEEKSYESTIDVKIQELQIELVKYFSRLNRSYTIETEKFQKYIFESLIDFTKADAFVFEKNIDTDKEKHSLSEIFKHFHISEKATTNKLDLFFSRYEKTLFLLENKNTLDLEDLALIVGMRRIHSVVQKWNEVLVKQRNINKSKDVFLNVINGLLQRKSIEINERNELIVRTQSNKIFPLTSLSSGEKQLLIILGQGLLQDENVHTYIADEPELSLHVEWQEKLVDSLKKVNPNSQIIFATHSPDIVSRYQNSVIQVEDFIK